MCKFDEQFNGEFKEIVELIEEIAGLTRQIKGLLEIIVDRTEIIGTALDVADLSVESVDAIMINLRKGYISQAEILIRWYLELSHLFYYLWKNPSRFKEWLNGKKIKPKKIGEFFEKEKMPSWRDVYEFLSEIVHNNEKFVSYHYGVDINTAKDQRQIMLVGKLLIIIAYLSCKIDHVLLKIICSYMGSDSAEMVGKYNLFEEKIIELGRMRINIENKIMAEYDIE